MKKIIAILAVVVIFVTIGIVIDVNNVTDVLIYSSMEEYRLVELQKQLKEEFPNYNIDVQYMSTNKSASKIKSEGKKTQVDIVLDLEFAYAKMLEENFAKVDFIDTSIYLDNLIISDKFYPNYISSFGVIVNNNRLKELGLSIPSSYDDLLKPEYEGEIIMPSPKASGTGYSFVKALLNYYGEEEGWKYFEELNKNMKMYTSSGSGPVNSLILGETTIGVGMVAQAVNEINKGVDLSIVEMKEGNGYNATANAIIVGKEKKAKVVEVFKFIQNEFVVYDKQNFMPENIYKEEIETNVSNYPKLKPMDMKGFDSLDEKERILAKWKY